MSLCGMVFFMPQKSFDLLAKAQLHSSWNILSPFSISLGISISFRPRRLEAYVLAFVPCVEHR